MATGTFMDASADTSPTPYTRELIYNTWWFEAIMGLFMINFIGNISKYRLLRRVKQNRRVPAWVIMRTQRKFQWHPHRRNWRRIRKKCRKFWKKRESEEKKCITRSPDAGKKSVKELFKIKKKPQPSSRPKPQTKPKPKPKKEVKPKKPAVDKAAHELFEDLF